MASACIAIGSNLGDRSAHLAQALQAIGQLEGVTQIQQGGVYETDPVGGPPGQGAFLNSAIRIQTTLAPDDLLAKLLQIERDAGRPTRDQREHWGPRPLDLDLLLYDDRVIDTPGLTLPHPRMHERDFVLRPLADVAGEWVHPVLGKTIRALFEELT